MRSDSSRLTNGFLSPRGGLSESVDAIVHEEEKRCLHSSVTPTLLSSRFSVLYYKLKNNPSPRVSNHTHAIWVVRVLTSMIGLVFFSLLALLLLHLSVYLILLYCYYTLSMSLILLLTLSSILGSTVFSFGLV